MQPLIPPDSYERERESDWQADFEPPRRSSLYAVIGFVVLATTIAPG